MPIASLDQVKEHLNLPSGDTSKDTELTAMLAAAVVLVEDVVGPMSRDLVEWHDGGRTAVFLDSPHVETVTSVTEYSGMAHWDLAEEPLDGDSFTAYGYTVDGPRIERRASGDASCFPAGRRNVRVAYTAGFADVPPNITQATLELTKHLWGSQQGGSVRQAQRSTGGWDPSQAFSMPNRVTQLLAPHRRVPGIA